MIKITDKGKCCGCSACYNICPIEVNGKKAIEMAADEEGFLYPKVDEELCINCHACEKVCFYRNNSEVSSNEKKYCLVQAKDTNDRMKSQSGGLFSLLADRFIDNGGIVYGVGYDESFHAVHKRAATYEEKEEFRGSKYVQSELGDVYLQVKLDLKNGKEVLFSGTPCQVQGLERFLHGKYRNQLLLVDLVCHGVPSPLIWEEYLKYIEQKNGRKITKVDFRCKKDYGWHSHIEVVEMEKKRYRSRKYTSIFYQHLMMRPSCYRCPFTNLDRISDITIGDSWGIDKDMPEIDDNKGTSLAIIHTNRGDDYFQSIRDYAKIYNVDINAYLQPQLKHPISVDVDMRKQFWKDYHQYGIDGVLRKYGDNSYKTLLKIFLFKYKMVRKIKEYIRGK